MSLENQKPSPLERALQKPTFDNLARLKSGRDDFSRMKFDALVQRLGNQPAIDNSVLEQADKVAAYRWVARGLPAAVAVKRIEVGHELRRKAEWRKLMDSDPDYYVSLLKDGDYEAERERFLDEKLGRTAAPQPAAPRQVAEPPSRREPEVVRLAGGAYRAEDLRNSTPGYVELVPEPKNIHDENAIKVMQDDNHLGFIPREIAPSITPYCFAKLASLDMKEMKHCSLLVYRCESEVERDDMLYADDPQKFSQRKQRLREMESRWCHQPRQLAEGRDKYLADTGFLPRTK